MAGMVKLHALPLAGAAFAFCLGIIAGTYIAALSFWLVMLVTAILTGVVLLFCRCGRPVHIYLATFLAFFSLGGFRLVQFTWYYPDNHIIRYCQGEQLHIATVRGVISGPVQLTEKKGALAKYDYRSSSGTFFDLDCNGIKDGGQWQSVSGIVRVYMGEPSIELRQGDSLAVTGKLYRRRVGDDEIGSAVRRSRIIVGMSVDHNELVERVATMPGSFPTLLENTKNNLRIILCGEDSAYDSDPDSVLAALMLGDRHGITAQVKEAFLRTGTMHYLSLSGLHIAILTGFVWMLLRLFKLPRWLLGLIPAVFVIGYMIVVPARPPIIRAGFVTVLFCLGYIFRRNSSPLNLLLFCGMVLLLYNPLNLFAVGFQLSFGIVTALIILSPAVIAEIVSDPTRIRLKEKFELTLLDDRPWYLQFLSKLKRWIGSAFAVSFVAWLVSLGLIAWYFSRISWFGAINSVFMAIPVTLAMLAGSIKILLAVLFPAFTSLDTILNWPVKLLLWVVNSLGQVSYCSENIPKLPGWFYWSYYSMLLITLYTGFVRKLYWAKWSLCGLILLVVVLIVMLPVCTDVDHMEMHALGVGHGCCVVMKMPGDIVMVYDCGSYDDFDIADREVVPYVRSLGVNSIDALLISHSDLDHYNGVPDLASAIPVVKAMVPAGFSNYFTQSDRDMLAMLDKEQLSLLELSAGDIISGKEFQAEILWPTNSDNISTNSGSLVIKIVSKGRSVLLCGDITPEVISQISSKYPELVADTILLPHHGEYSHELKLFIEKLGVSEAVLSAGRISADRLKSLQALSVELHQLERGRTLILK